MNKNSISEIFFVICLYVGLGNITYCVSRRLEGIYNTYNQQGKHNWYERWVLCNLKQHQKTLKRPRTVHCCAFCCEVDCCTQHKKAPKSTRTMTCTFSLKDINPGSLFLTPLPPLPSLVYCLKLYSTQSCPLLTDNVTPLVLLLLYVDFRRNDVESIGQMQCNY